MSYEDKTVECRDCGGQFIFTAGEQEFYAQKGFLNNPTRCPAGRRARKFGGEPGGVGDGILPCPHDCSGQGRPPVFETRATDLARSNERGRSAERGRSDSRPRFDERSRNERSTYSGPLPSGQVLATVLRVDRDQRFVFVQVDQPNIDVYVHSSLFNRLPRPLREGDRVRVTVADSERGLRATSLETAH